jgi:flavin-dependent dehydrogenase
MGMDTLSCMKSVRILGAGLSGLSAAITLAHVGIKVTVYEKQPTCGARFKGDFEGLENWTARQDILDELRAMNIKTDFFYQPVKTLHMTDGHEVVKFSSDPPFCYIVKRGTSSECLDQALMRQAYEAGVEIQFNAALDPGQADVIATGPSSTHVTALVKGVTFETDHEDIAVAMVGKTWAPHGYSYLLVSGGIGCISTVCPYEFENIAGYFSATYERLCSLFGVTVKNPRECGGFGSFLLKQRLEDESRLYVGEAAGLQDLLWGFGMRHALVSGHLAGVSLSTGESYVRLVQQRLTGVMRTGVVNRFWVEHLKAYESFLIRSIREQKEGTHRAMMYRAFNPSLESRMVYPVAWLYLYRKHSGRM